jgi:UDP-glucose 4-epimerase
VNNGKNLILDVNFVNNHMRILVTGGAGFIGSHIVDQYINDGHTVHIIDNLLTGKIENINKDAKFIHKDINNILDLTDEYDIVNHHAAQMNVRKSVSDPIYDAHINILGSIKVFMFAARCKATIIFASSGGTVYGEQQYFPADEDHPTKPASPYGIAKLSAENYLRYFAEANNLTTYVLRYANVYGPRQNPHGEAGVISIFIDKLLRGEQPIINGDGKQTRDFVFVKDVANINRIYNKSLETNFNIFNVGSGIEISIVEVYNTIGKLMKSDIQPLFGPPKTGEQLRSCLKSNRHTLSLIDFTAGLSATIGRC